MNILLIGNGFDLAHELPTSYGDFLDYVECFAHIKSSNFNLTYGNFLDWETENKKELSESLNSYFKDKLLGNMGDQSYLYKNNHLHLLSKENIWIDGFLKRRSNLGQNWIDLESEISLVIQIIEKWYAEDYNISDTKKISLISENYKLLRQQLTPSGKRIPLEDLIKLLIAELDDLIQFLELYLLEITVKPPTKISPDIKDLKYDFVLTFNYTDTHEKLYKQDFFDEANEIDYHYDYIHGKATKENWNNMVLGIDEYLEGESASTELDFIYFKKYFQRICKPIEGGCPRTVNMYKFWLEHAQDARNEFEPDIKPYKNGYSKTLPPKDHLYIFGHSLDVTDKDILIELIENENIVTTIYYHDKKSFAQKIINLVRLISKDKLIKYINGDIPKITFKPQKAMIDTPILTTK